MEASFPLDHPRQKGHMLRSLLQLKVHDVAEGRETLLDENNYREKMQSCANNDSGQSSVEDYVEIHINYIEH